MKFKQNVLNVSLSIILLSNFNMVYGNVPRKDFDVSIGNKKQEEIVGTITLSGNGGKGGNEPSILKKSPLNTMNKGKFSESISTDEAKKTFENIGGEDVLVFEGGNNKNKNNQQQLKYPKLKSNTNNVGGEKNSLPISSSYSDLAKEIPIPTDFNILKNALSANDYAKMPVSAAPVGLPEFSYNAGLIDEKSLRSVIRSIANAGKSANKTNISSNNLDLNKEEIKEEYKEVVLNRVEQKWYNALKQESQLMMLSGLPMKIMLIPSKDNLMFNFMLSNVARGNETSISQKKFDDGIFALLGKPFINGRVVPMCYLVFDDLVEEYENKILSPLERKIGMDATAAFVVAHNVGICLDQLERDNKIPKSKTWYISEVHKIGLYPPAFQSLFPNGMRSNIYSLKENEIMGNNAQRQYQQRLVDSFAVLWAYNRGFKNIAKSLIEVKSYLPEYSTHNTIKAIQNIEGKLRQMRANTLTLSKIWKFARENQKISDVSSELQKADYNILYKPQVSELKQEKVNQLTTNYIPVNNFGNSMSNTKNMNKTAHMNTTNNMKNITKTVSDAKTPQQMSKFDKTKTESFSSMNFNVTEMIKQDLDTEKVKLKYGLVKVEKEVKPKKEDKKKEVVSFNQLNKGLSETNKKDEQSNKEKNVNSSNLKEKNEKVVEKYNKKPLEKENGDKKIKLEDGIRNQILKEYDFNDVSNPDSQFKFEL